MIPLPPTARALLYIAAGLPEARRILARRPHMAAHTTRTLATVQRGDTLLLADGRRLGVTALIPASTDDAVAHGAREVVSGSWSMTLEGADTVAVWPRVDVHGGPADDAYGRWEYAQECAR